MRKGLLHLSASQSATRYTGGVALDDAGWDVATVWTAAARLLRELRMDRSTVRIPAGWRLSATPATPLRGHQIGYRPKTNSYDGWTLAMWEQYLRDLIGRVGGPAAR